VFVVVTLLVALGIAVAQGCQGPARGLGGDGGRVVQEQGQGQKHMRPDLRPLDDGRSVARR
jgi:hypothetical protein